MRTDLDVSSAVPIGQVLCSLPYNDSKVAVQ